MKNRLTRVYYRHRFIASVCMLVGLFVFGSAGLVLVSGETLEPNDSRIVSLYADGREIIVPSRAKTVGEFLSKVEVELSEADIVEPAIDQAIESDQFRIRVVRARPYEVRIDNQSVPLLSAHTSPRLIVEDAGFEVKFADAVEFVPLESESSPVIGRAIKVVRAKQVTLSLFGTPELVYTNALTVGDFIKDLEIDIAEGDEISLDLSTPIVEGLIIAINRSGVNVVTEEVAIDPPVEYLEDANLSLGSVAVRDPGSLGKRLVTYEIVTVNNQEVGRVELSSVIVEQPRVKIVARGRAVGQIGAEKIELMMLAGISADEYAAADYIITRESGWCATKWQGQWGYCPGFYEEIYSGAEQDRSRGYGLCQSTPAIKMASAGDDWRTNAVTQLRWCTNYARGRYGDWNRAYDFWIVNKWW